MPTTTTTYSFNKPVVGADEDSWGEYLNGNWDSVDNLLDGTTPVTGIDINSGTIDNVVIGGATPAAGTFTTLTATSTATFAGLTTTADITFGDGDKAIFGAGSDLQIYHDGSNSYIEDGGVGNINVKTNVFRVYNAAGDEISANFVQNGAVTLYYDNAPKVATTSTGANITGTLTSDGLTVDASVATQATAIQLNGSSFADTERLSLDFARGGSEGVRLSLEPDQAQTNGDFIIETGGFGSTSDRLRIEGNGDISFYEDTGTTPKFFWDASAESLGIGTSSPSFGLDSRVNNGSNPVWGYNIANIVDGQTNSSGLRIASDASTDGIVNLISATNAAASQFAFWTFNGSSWGERMRIDSSGNLLLGTTSNPSSRKLSVYGIAEIDGPGVGLLAFKSSNTSIGSVGQGNYVVSGGPSNGFGMQSEAELVFGTNGSTERMRIDSSGNVGIGTSSPTLDLSVDGDIWQGNGGGVELGRVFNDAGVWHMRASGNVNGLAFGTNNLERMRIDSSGNLLVGKTSTSFGTEGQELRASGQTLFTRDSAQVLSLNLKTADGDILGFYKNGTTVGSIGVNGGTNLTIGTGSTGLIFNDNFDTIYGVNVSTNATLDGTIDLGYPTKRFKDLYLSGGVYLGGTGAANKLDDYEEGTWTATLEGTTTNPSTSVTTTARYTKVGRLVTVTVTFSGVDTTGASGAVRISGLPFTLYSGQNGRAHGSVMMTDMPISTGSSFVVSRAQNGGTYIDFYESGDGTNTAAMVHSAGAGKYLATTISYEAA
jgi:hypothetical protein